MPKLIDLTGQRFGRWTVLERAPNRNRTVYWLCQCDCGTIKEVKGQCLREGESTSCGCYQKEKASQILSIVAKKNLRNLVGQKFGHLTVIAPSSRRSPNGQVYWKCQCDCGKIIEAQGGRLRNGNITHCGCQTVISKGELKIRELLTQHNIDFETQKTFNSCRYPDTNVVARFDFWVNNSYIIEYDGNIHTIIAGWITPEKLTKTQQHDQIKNNWCHNNHITLIRIPYTHYNDLCINDLLPETSNFII